MKRREKAIQEGTIRGSDLKLWCDESKLEKRGIRAAVVWKSDWNSKEWQMVKVSLGQNKESFDTELWEISKAIKVVE